MKWMGRRVSVGASTKWVIVRQLSGLLLPGLPRRRLPLLGPLDFTIGPHLLLATADAIRDA